MSATRLLTVGIDATNLMGGGGRTHLIELLRSADPVAHGIGQVVVWAAESTLRLLHDVHWLRKESAPELNGGKFARILWQRNRLPDAARRVGCDVLFAPGGSHAGRFHPIVTMCQNMLPFDWSEMWRYKLSPNPVRLTLLRFVQSRSFRSADGVIFLTEYAREAVTAVTGPLLSNVVIPHGTGTRFQIVPREQQEISEYSVERPFRLLYVSIIDQYKHQWHVIEGIYRLREQTGWPVEVHLVGPAFPPALRRLREAMRRFDPDGAWAIYRGQVSYDELHSVYAEADAGLFASSCENLPIILLETMAAGLPIACSDRGPMPEVLRSAGVYFNPEKPAEIAAALNTLIGSASLRADLAHQSHSRALNFTWQRCADRTFSYLADAARRDQTLGSGA